MNLTNSPMLTDVDTWIKLANEQGTNRVLLHQMSYWERNRGGQGVEGRHVHKVAHDIMSQKVGLERYAPISLVRIPEHRQLAVQQMTFDEYNNGPFLPNITWEDKSLPKAVKDAVRHVKYSPMTRNHFLRAMNSLAQGGRTFAKCRGLTTSSDVNQNDEEGAYIPEDGPQCTRT